MLQLLKENKFKFVRFEMPKNYKPISKKTYSYSNKGTDAKIYLVRTDTGTKITLRIKTLSGSEGWKIVEFFKQMYKRGV